MSAARGRKRATRDPRKSRIKPSMLGGYGPRMSQRGRPGERRNLNRLRYVRPHSETLWDSGEAHLQVAILHPEVPRKDPMPKKNSSTRSKKYDHPQDMVLGPKTPVAVKTPKHPKKSEKR